MPICDSIKYIYDLEKQPNKRSVQKVSYAVVEEVDAALWCSERVVESVPSSTSVHHHSVKLHSA